MKRPFLDFYENHHIIPVRQEDSIDLTKHYNRRRSLYISLGILPSSVRGAKVLEIGPGTGDNAIYTSSLSPKSIRFVDGNKESINELKDRAKGGSFGGVPVDIIYQDFLGYEDSDRYDLVLCEGLITGQKDPSSFLKKVAGCCDDGGIVVITNITTVGLLSEICRRVVLPVYRERYSEEEVHARLVAHFTPDLDALGNVSRLYGDWVWDNIIHPWGNMEFTIEESIKRLSSRFEFLGSSPRFYTDWRWYKKLDNQFNQVNSRACQQYLNYELGLLDCRVEPCRYNMELVNKVKLLCQQAFDLHQEILKNGDKSSYNNFFQCINAIASELDSFQSITSDALRDYLIGMEKLMNLSSLGSQTAVDFGGFINFWGRGQQYSSYLAVS